MIVLAGSELLIANSLIALASACLNSVTSLVRLEEAQKANGINLELEKELERGQFCKQILYNDKPINAIQLSEVMKEKIIQIDRCCQSIWQYFPSGIATIFTWALTGQAMRHEFVIIDTTNHICSLELVKDKNEQQEQIQKLVFKIYGLVTEEQRKKIRYDQILKNRHYDRVLSSIKLNHQMYLSQINQFQNLILICWEKMYENKTMLSEWYEFFQKMSKQYARSILYFSQEQPNYHIVLQSIIGIFTDKPFYFRRIDMEIIEKLIWAVGQGQNEEMKSSIKKFIGILKFIREGRDFSQSPSIQLSSIYTQN
ncbi:unnamed protein product (macronuclear) [Paramecium tetraurelia]|uniref:Uncharacterized protein n=1 Tax=Paramecium tetraurelia TaxID=5888 RepID=A0E8Z1_PARTE|nr:uncharacterized protein GSPATT00024489001 [Paramecium tetraurelia]CAK91758.1 unnamed protein product [Paramecium tetraurelia]|eukprot:XP_001459155.1 hypothetical protein (macronuclear) [Paramecium tetraurelia strain d4-2]